MGIDSLECIQCKNCYSEDTMRSCGCCYHQFCEHCLWEVKDALIIDLECEEKMKYCEYLKMEGEDDYYEILECPYCIKDLDKAQVDDVQIVEYVMKNYNLTREQLEKSTKEDRCS